MFRETTKNYSRINSFASSKMDEEEKVTKFPKITHVIFDMDGTLLDTGNST
jgi:hypothetical protein